MHCEANRILVYQQGGKGGLEEILNNNFKWNISCFHVEMTGNVFAKETRTIQKNRSTLAFSSPWFSLQYMN